MYVFLVDGMLACWTVDSLRGSGVQTFSRANHMNVVYSLVLKSYLQC